MAEAEEDAKTHLPSLTERPDRSFSIDTCEFIQRVLDKCIVSIVEDPVKTATKCILDVLISEEAFGDGTRVKVKNLRDILENKDTSTCLREMREMIRANPNSYVTFKYALARTGQVLLLQKIETIETDCHDGLKQKGQNLYGCVCTDDTRCPLQEPLKYRLPLHSSHVKGLPSNRIMEPATGPLETTEANDRYQRWVSSLDKGGEMALRNLFNTKVPPATLAAHLNNQKNLLNGLKSGRMVTDDQWDLLYPATGHPPDSTTFDLKLLACLLRHICNLNQESPALEGIIPAKDISVEADICRLKHMKDEACHMAPKSLTEQDYRVKMTMIGEIMLRLEEEVYKASEEKSSIERSIEKEGQSDSEEIPSNNINSIQQECQKGSENISSITGSIGEEGQKGYEETSSIKCSIEDERHADSVEIPSSNNLVIVSSCEQEEQNDSEESSSTKNSVDKEVQNDSLERLSINNSTEQGGKTRFEERASLIDTNDQDNENGLEEISSTQNNVTGEVTPNFDEISSEVPPEERSHERLLVQTCTDEHGLNGLNKTVHHLKNELDIQEEPMDKTPSNHGLVVDALRETKEYMALLNEWIPKRESTIREIESIASELSVLRTLKQRDSPSQVLELRNVKKIGKVAKVLALGGGAAAVAGAILGGGLATPSLLTGTAGAVAGGPNSSGSDIVDKHLPEGQLQSAQNVRNKDEALCARLDSVKLNLDLKIMDLSQDEKLSFEQVQCSLLMATMIEGDFALETPFQVGKMLMTSEPFAKILSNSFGKESATDPCMASTEAEESVKAGDLIALRMLGVAPVESIHLLIKESMDIAKGSLTEASKCLGNVARKLMKQVKDIRDFLQKLRNQTACFERIMRDHFHKRLEEVSTQGLATDDDRQIITFMLKYSSNAWQQAFRSLNVNLNEFAFHLARVFSNTKQILDEERNKRQGNHRIITVIAHGRIDPHTLVPCHIYYFNNCLASVTLYSPWGCAIDTSVIYGIATDTMMPKNVHYSADVSPERPTTWNYLPREATLAPNIKCTPFLEGEGARHALLNFVDTLRSNSDDVMIPYFTRIGNGLLPYPEVPLWVFANAVGMCAQSLNLTINLKLAACLSPEKPDTAGTELSQFCQVPMDLNRPVLMTSQLDTDQEAAEKVNRLL